MNTATELLRRIMNVESNEHIDNILEDIRIFLAAEPEAEPVAYLFDADSYCDHAPIKDELVQSLPKGMLRQKIKNVRPLYTKPEPARKPMTEDEIKIALLIRGFPYDAFRAGVRFAEKHHELGANPSDPDSIDLQSRCRGDKL